MKNNYLNLVIFLSMVQISLSSVPLKFTKPEECEENDFFDESHLRCVSCNSNPDNANGGRGVIDDRNANQSQNRYMIKTDDGFGCICQPGSHLKGDNKCELCPDGFVSSLDGFNCLKCESPGIFDNRTKMCKCTGFKTEVVEQNENRNQSANRVQDLQYLQATACHVCHATQALSVDRPRRATVQLINPK